MSVNVYGLNISHYEKLHIDAFNTKSIDGKNTSWNIQNTPCQTQQQNRRRKEIDGKPNSFQNYLLDRDPGETDKFHSLNEDAENVGPARISYSFPLYEQ